jgi:hypothetical protein
MLQCCLPPGIITAGPIKTSFLWSCLLLIFIISRTAELLIGRKEEAVVEVAGWLWPLTAISPTVAEAAAVKLISSSLGSWS